MDNYNEWLDLDRYHNYVETEPLLSPLPSASPAPRPPDKKEKPKASKMREIVMFLVPTLIALTLAGALRGFVFTNTRVPTASMENTIMTGSRLIGSKLSYFSQDPQRFDIVIFKFPDDESQDYVKRIIGLPGEKVEIRNGKIYINDSKTALTNQFVTACIPTGNYGPYYVPEDCYFMMGDNREDSSDSRFWDNPYVKREKIIAEVKFQYYPELKKIQ